MEPLSANIPIHETIDDSLDQIYNKKKLKPICSKLIFIRFLLKLATEVTFTINNNFYKQTNRCTIWGRLSITFRDIFMIKMEINRDFNETHFYRRYVDDIYNRRKKSAENNSFFFSKINIYTFKRKKN